MFYKITNDNKFYFRNGIVSIRTIDRNIQYTECIYWTVNRKNEIINYHKTNYLSRIKLFINFASDNMI